MSFKFDYKEQGLSKLFNEYEIAVLECLWKSKQKKPSRFVWEHVSVVDKIQVSRASVINFLNQMVDEGYLDYEDTTGKGGVRRLYSQKYSKEDFVTQIALTMLKSLLSDFESSTMSAINTILPQKPVSTRLDLSPEDIKVLYHLTKMNTATVDELYTVAVKYHGIKSTRIRIKELLDLVAQHT